MSLFRDMRKPKIHPSYDVGIAYLHAAVSFLYANCCSNAKPSITKDQMFSLVESAYNKSYSAEKEVLAAVKTALNQETLAPFSYVNILDAHEFANNNTHDCIGYDCD